MPFFHNTKHPQNIGIFLWKGKKGDKKDGFFFHKIYVIEYIFIKTSLKKKPQFTVLPDMFFFSSY